MNQTFKIALHIKILIIFLSLGFGSMLIASVAQRFINPDLTISRFSNQKQTITSENKADPGMSAIGQLMETVSKDPNNGEAILRLVESLMAVGQWQSAENFAQKAIALPNQPEQNSLALYLLAIIHHNQGRHEQAAELLEKLLDKKENPSARYSLGILYLHFLNNPENGIINLQKGLQDPTISPALANAMREELEKAQSHNAKIEGSLPPNKISNRSSIEAPSPKN